MCVNAVLRPVGIRNLACGIWNYGKIVVFLTELVALRTEGLPKWNYVRSKLSTALVYEKLKVTGLNLTELDMKNSKKISVAQIFGGSPLVNIMQCMYIKTCMLQDSALGIISIHEATGLVRSTSCL
jgi:hypothetical protein